MRVNTDGSLCKAPDRIEPLQELTLFTTALCNLQCTYCYICKDNNHALKKIDNDLARDWQAHAYPFRARTELRYEDIQNIRTLSLWGGEPLIGMRRFLPQFQEFYELFPSLNTVDFSTNLTLPNAVEILDELFRTIGGTAKRGDFTVTLQISIDGPACINNKNRGAGTTEKILENFRKLLALDIPDNVQVQVSTKPTLSNETFEWFLEEENVRKYYGFFEQAFWQPYRAAQTKLSSLFLGIPNYAEPFGYTKEDGETFAQVCRVFQQVSRAHCMEGFRGRSLVPYVDRYSMGGSRGTQYDSYLCGGACGKLVYGATMTPHGRYSVCHRTLFDSYVEYHNTAHDAALTAEAPYIDDGCNFGPEQFRKQRQAVNYLYHDPHKLLCADTKTMLKLLAAANMIDPKYREEHALEEVLNFMCRPGMCLASNKEVCHSLFVQPYWWPRLFLNGAMDVMLEELRGYDNA